MRDPRSVPGTVSNDAQHACAWKTYLDSVNIYHTGIDVLPKVGDYISWLISGTARLEAGWYSDDISAYRIAANGLLQVVHRRAAAGSLDRLHHHAVRAVLPNGARIQPQKVG